MPWIQLSFDAPRIQAEQFGDALEAAGACSVTFGDAADEPQLEPGPGETPLWSQITVTALFEDEPAYRALVERMARELSATLDAPAQITRIEDRIWERVWLDTFKPTRFGERLWVCPHGQSPDDPEAVVVWLDPGLAFGTGHHPTTALCLEWLDRADLAGKTLLDYGCGSGILAIAALKLGAAQVIAVDHDPQALDATCDNAEANRVSERLSVHAPETLPKDCVVDCVLANILAGPLIELAPTLIERLRPAGALTLSGVLAEQVAGVSAAYAEQITLDPPQFREDWALICGRRSMRSHPPISNLFP